ncbi:actin family [Podospora aff. communis PSN243]|uniref:Centractin n=1 Tax=Podospora aff. communis PSN243 TaxID=3040156 RepID=A0AAV9GEY7_9PEZI|nr:actin family [Podospora aff. communis PSN243]
MEEEVTPLVIDHGSDLIKAGFAGDDFPKVLVHCDSPSHRCHRPVKSTEASCRKVSQRPNLTSNGAVSRGAISTPRNRLGRDIENWDDVEKVWRHIFHNKLGVSPNDHPLLVAEPVLISKPNREKMTTVVFENLDVPAFYACQVPVLAMYAAGRTTGTVLGLGHHFMYSASVYEGYAQHHSIFRNDLAGLDLTNYLARTLAEKGCAFPKTTEGGIVREIKKKLCYVAVDPEQEAREAAKSSCLEKTYTLPDGRVLTIGDERFWVPEALFQPEILDLKTPGVHELLCEGINRCDSDVRRELYGNIVMEGGSTMFPGIAERLYKEVTALAPNSVKVKIVAPPERKYSVWIGGSILASLSTFQGLWISKAEYSESGASIVHRKCF